MSSSLKFLPSRPSAIPGHSVIQRAIRINNAPCTVTVAKQRLIALDGTLNASTELDQILTRFDFQNRRFTSDQALLNAVRQEFTPAPSALSRISSMFRSAPPPPRPVLRKVDIGAMLKSSGPMWTDSLYNCIAIVASEQQGEAVFSHYNTGFGMAPRDLETEKRKMILLLRPTRAVKWYISLGIVWKNEAVEEEARRYKGIKHDLKSLLNRLRAAIDAVFPDCVLILPGSLTAYWYPRYDQLATTFNDAAL